MVLKVTQDALLQAPPLAALMQPPALVPLHTVLHLSNRGKHPRERLTQATAAVALFQNLTAYTDCRQACRQHRAADMQRAC